MKEKVAVSKRLSENIAQMEEFFHECDDIKKKELMLGRQMDVACYLTFIEVSVDMGTSALSEVLNYFYLVVRGDSMEPRIQDGDLALVHKQDTLENGDLGVLVYGDEGEGTLKRYIQRGNCVVLQPFNPAYNELVIKGEDLNRLHIAGRVVETKAKW